MFRASSACKSRKPLSAVSSKRKYVTSLTTPPTVAKFKFTEQSENVYENKGSMLEGTRLNRECL